MCQRATALAATHPLQDILGGWWWIHPDELALWSWSITPGHPGWLAALVSMHNGVGRPLQDILGSGPWLCWRATALALIRPLQDLLGGSSCGSSMEGRPSSVGEQNLWPQSYLSKTSWGGGHCLFESSRRSSCSSESRTACRVANLGLQHTSTYLK